MKAAKKKLKEPTRRDGRKAMLVYMKPELIKAVKDAAEAGDEKAWQFVERAVNKALKSKRP
jgi:predicted HicB family RNase H-like nuclease